MLLSKEWCITCSLSSRSITIMMCSWWMLRGWFIKRIVALRYILIDCGRSIINSVIKCLRPIPRDLLNFRSLPHFEINKILSKANWTNGAYSFDPVCCFFPLIIVFMIVYSIGRYKLSNVVPHFQWAAIYIWPTHTHLVNERIYWIELIICKFIHLNTVWHYAPIDTSYLRMFFQGILMPLQLKWYWFKWRLIRWINAEK